MEACRNPGEGVGRSLIQPGLLKLGHHTGSVELLEFKMVGSDFCILSSPFKASFHIPECGASLLIFNLFFN